MNRNTAWLDAIISFLKRSFLPHARFPGRVVSQRPNGSLEVQPDSDRVGTHDFVVVRIGVPGVTVKVPTGARVVLSFAEGDPKKPFAELLEAAAPIEIKVDAQTIIFNSGATPVAKEGSGTTGHSHTLTGATAGPYPVLGSTLSATDTIAVGQGSPTVKVP